MMLRRDAPTGTAGWTSWSFLVFGALALTLVLGATAQAQTGPDNLKYSFQFEPPMLMECTLGGLDFTSIGMPGAHTLARNVGDPALPVQFVQILLPPNKVVKGVRVTGSMRSFDTGPINLASSPIIPQQRPLPFGEKQPATLEMNNQVYQSHAQFPAEDFGGEQLGYSRGFAIFSLGLSPVKYVPATGKLTWFPEMTVEIELEDGTGANPLYRGKASDMEWVQMLVQNPELAKTYTQGGSKRAEYPGGLCDPADDYDYVIITTTQNGLDYWDTSAATPYNWESLMDHHTASGLACQLVTLQDILAVTAYQNSNPLFNDTPARIREFCKDAYQDWGIDYVLIGGDDEWITSREMDASVESNVNADIYWNHLDKTFNDDGDSNWGEEGDTGFDEYCEFYIGRLTCDIPKDVSNWMNKAFFYTGSEDPFYLDNAAFYGGDTGWNCEGDDFEDYSAIYGTDNWLGPNPGASPSYPAWLGFQYGFETWNLENPGLEYDMSIKWTAEPPNPGGWMGGSSSAAINGLRAAISADNVALLSGIAHANEYMALDVNYTDWEASYHNTMPFFIHDYGCHCGDMDAADDGVLHSMLFHSDTELAFACVFNTGYGWGHFDHTGSSSAVQQKSFWDYLFDVTNNSGNTNNWQMGKAQAYSKDLMAPSLSWSDGTWRSIIQCCLLFGDPAMQIRPPAEPALFMTFPEALPSGYHPPGPETTMQVEIKGGKENLVPGSATLYYRYDSSDPYTAVALTDLGSDMFEGTLPNTKPGDTPEFYFSAEGSGGTVMLSPFQAPAMVYSFELCFIDIVMEENFETETGWTVQNTAISTGAFERADPAPTTTQPGDDHSVNGTKCFVTGPLGGSSGDYDVDGGPTRLFSPEFDLSTGDAEISFYYWFYHSSNGTQEPLDMHITNNGVTWVRFAQISNTPAWTLHSVKVSDYVVPNSSVQIRISAEDNPNDSVVEALIDDLMIRRYDFDPSLWADGYSIPVSAATAIDLTLDAGAANGGRPYLVLGSLTGTSPGYVLPGGKVLPLNWDAFTDLIMLLVNTPVFGQFMGTLDGAGGAIATVNTGGPLDPVLIGETAHFAYVLGNPIDFASNAIPVSFDP